MKRNLIILLLATLFPLAEAACQKNSYTLYGKVADHSLDGSYLQIKKYRLRPQESIYIDSVKIENGQFIFGGSTDEPYLMVIANVKGFWSRFVAEPGKIRIAFDPAKDYLRATVSGTRINNDYQKLIIEPSNSYWTVMGPLYEKQKEGLKAGTWTSDDETALDNARPKGNWSETQKKRKDFIDKYIQNADVVQEQLFFSLTNEIDWKRHNQDKKAILGLDDDNKYEYADDNARWLSKLSKTYRKQMDNAVEEYVEMMAEIRERIKNKKLTPPKIREILPESVQEGQRFTDFNGTTADGQPFSLRQAGEENKLVMLDFWASWCMPCLKMMPEMAALHEKYKDKGLLVVGISSDQSEGPWRKAMEKFKMVWPQVRSAEKDRVGEIYGIRTIPYAILIDHNGTIVARNLRGEELANKIAEILK